MFFVKTETNNGQSGQFLAIHVYTSGVLNLVKNDDYILI